MSAPGSSLPVGTGSWILGRVIPIDWLFGLAGGALIGVSATLLMLFNGRVAGISGVVGAVLSPVADRSERRWRLAFVTGLVLSGALLYRVAPAAFGAVAAVPTAHVVAAGLLVGFGTQLGRGCTSGHGVCGISRWSVRSIVGVVTFMLSGGVTVYLLHHT